MTTLIISEFNKLIDLQKYKKEKGWQFKLKNYQNVIKILEKSELQEITYQECLKLLRKEGMKIPNPKTSKIMLKINKILEDGTLGLEIDEGVSIIRELCRIPEIGPAKAKKLYEEGVTKIEDIDKDIDNYLNDKQKIGYRYYLDLEKRIPRTEMEEWNRILCKIVNEELKENVSHYELAGSYRRNLVDSGDIDCYIAVKKIKKSIMDKIVLRLISDGYLIKDDIWSKGNHKLMAVIKMPSGLARHLDIWIYPENEYPFAILYATGCGEFNVKMRNFAKTLGYSLSDKCLRYGSNKGDIITPKEIESKIGKNVIEFEEDIFDFLGIKWYEPFERVSSIEF